MWALNDVVRLLPALTLNAYGHYYESYEKLGGQWLIKTSKLRNAGAKLARRSAD